MVVCASCGAENEADAKSCKNCGSPMLTATSSSGSEAPPPPKDIGREMAEMGKKMGEEFKRAGEKLGNEIGTRGPEFGVWWDKTLGWFSPVVASLFGIVGFFVALLVVGAIGGISDHPAFWNDLSAFMERYWWLFLGLAVLEGFQGYFRRRYLRTFRWINPVFNGIGSVAWFWILAQVLKFASVDWNQPQLGDLGNFVEDFLIVLVILVVIISYLFAFWRSVSPANCDPGSRPPP